jgi:hypothetical protein
VRDGSVPTLEIFRHPSRQEDMSRFFMIGTRQHIDRTTVRFNVAATVMVKDRFAIAAASGTHVRQRVPGSVSAVRDDVESRASLSPLPAAKEARYIPRQPLQVVGDVPAMGKVVGGKVDLRNVHVRRGQRLEN